MKKIVSILLALSMLLSCVACSSEDDNETKENIAVEVKTTTQENIVVTHEETTKEITYTKEEKDTTENSSPYNFSSAKVGDYITFGSYEQDNDTTNGAEEIEWLILDKQDNNILVISRYGLDCQPYHYTYTDMLTWENCTLRGWLNNEFINTAFTSTQKEMIPTVIVKAEDNPIYNTIAGKDTYDKVFLLGIFEAGYKYFSSTYGRGCKPTSYAKAKGASDYYYGNCSWWLRSPGEYNGYPSTVDFDGNVYEVGYACINTVIAVRPAMWINI